jgi:hypothetical protein
MKKNIEGLQKKGRVNAFVIVNQREIGNNGVHQNMASAPNG